MKKGKRILAVVLAFAAFVLFARTSLLGIRGLITANAAPISVPDNFTLGELRLNHSTGTVNLTRNSQLDAVAAVRFTSLKTGHTTVADFDGIFEFYLTKSSGSSIDYDPDNADTILLGTAEACVWSEVTADFLGVDKAVYNGYNDASIAAVWKATFDTSRYQAGDTFYMWVNYVGNANSFYQNGRSNTRKVVIVEAADVEINSVDNVELGNSDDVTVTVSSNYGVESGTVIVSLINPDGTNIPVGSAFVTLGSDTKSGSVTITIPADKLTSVGEYTVSVKFDPDGSSGISDSEVTDKFEVYAANDTGDNIKPTISAERYDSAPTDGPVNVTFDVGDNMTAPQDLTVTVSDAQKNNIPVVNNNGVCSFEAAENNTYTIVVKDAAGNQRTDTVVINNINAPTAPDDTAPPVISNDRQDKDTTPGTVRVTFNVADDNSSPEDLQVTVKEPDGSEKSITPDADGNCSFDAVRGGTYTVTAEDEAGNITSPYSIVVTIATLPAVNTPPVVNVRPHNTAQTPGPVNVEFTISDDSTPAKDLTLEVKSSTGKPVTNVARNNGECSFAVTENGTYIITVSDKDGSSATQNVVIDNIQKAQAPDDDNNGDDAGSEDRGEAGDDADKQVQAVTQPSVIQPPTVKTPALEPTKTTVQTEKEMAEYTSPKTADNSSRAAVISAAVALVMAAIGVTFKRKKF